MLEVPSLSPSISILTSVDSLEYAKSIAQQLIQQHLAGCVQQTTGLSTYQWDDSIEYSHEYYLHIKTHPDLKDQVIAWLETNHPYDTPEIIVLDSSSSQAYGDWLYSQTHQA